MKRGKIQIGDTMEDWKNKLKDLPVADVRAFDEIDSTNNFATQWVHQGAEDRSLVIANRQTSGRGRMGRIWQTAADASLAFSYILKPTPRETPSCSFFSPLGALAVCEAILPYGVSAEIKWPNDVLLNRKKVCGILSEVVWQEDNIAAIVLGIGVNIASESIPESQAGMYPASSIAIETGQEIDRIQFLNALLIAIDAWRLSINSSTFFDEWNRQLAFKGEKVQLQPVQGEPLSGTLVGINSFGALLLQNSAGLVQSFLAGDVHLRPAEEPID
jgi:BirA family biotin operon repressor/biotin-[acetyl-CoA-carboxylase] ligase